MNSYPTNNVITELAHLAQASGPINWLDQDPLVVDAVRGSVKEQGWRGTLREYFQSHLFKPIIEETINRLQQLDEYKIPAIMPLGYKLGLGTYGWKYDPNIITEAYRLGILFFDTAESYGYGKVENKLGIITHDLPEVCVATKVARNHLSYESTMRAAKRSRLNLDDSLYLYQAHWPNTAKVQDTMLAMATLADEGVIGGIGVSNYSIDQYLMAAGCTLPYPIESIQVRYSLFDRSIERALLPWMKTLGVNVIAYSPLGQDFSMYRNNPVLADVARVEGLTTAQVALAWVMSKGVLPIPRTNSLTHLYQLVECVKVSLRPESIERLEVAYPIGE